jgi:hypothetical protein
LPSHLGDSGKKNIPISYRVEGTPDNPNMVLQCGLKMKTKITEKSCPPVINAVLIAISFPLISMGATSLK